MRKFLVLFLLAFSAVGQDQSPFFKDVELASQWDSGIYFDNTAQYASFSAKGIDALEMDWFVQRNALQKSLSTSTLSDKDKEYWSREVNLQYWHLLYAYPIRRGNDDQNLKRLISLPEDILRGFKAQVFQEDEAVVSTAFRNLVYYYLSYENSRQRNFEKYTNMLEMFNDKVEFAERRFKGKVKDYALARLLQEYQALLTVPVAQRTANRIEDAELRARFGENFLAGIPKAKGVAAGPELKFLNLQGQEVALSSFKGKVVYVDFWASWCGPCKVQFPFAKTLHKEVKDVVFLNLSLDDTAERWKEGIKENALEEFTHGYLPEGWRTPLLLEKGVNGIPRYMIVDKTGAIRDFNAKRPNDPELFPILVKYTQE
jgi:thiol-disulfide isomerase/thioredoxin